MAGTRTSSYTAANPSFVGLLAVWPRAYGGVSGLSCSDRALLSSIVIVTSLSPSVEKSFSFQVTSVPSALVVPTALALPATTLAFGSAKVQVGITVQFVKGSGNIPVGFPSTSRISRSFSSWPKSILNRPAHDRIANCELATATTTANSMHLNILSFAVFIDLGFFLALSSEHFAREIRGSE